MNIKIKIIIFSTLSVLFLCLTACSSKTSQTSQNTAKVAKKNISAEADTYPKENFKAPFKAIGQGVPVLMYHSVSTDQGNPINPIIISPNLLEQEFQYIKDNGYTPITLDDLYNYLVNKTNIPSKSIVLTFDDGYENNYTTLFPLLKKYGFRATLFIITSYIDKNPNYLTSKQLKEMDSYGVDIESHTVTHPYLNKLTSTEQMAQLTDSKAYLEKLLNKKINYISYPYGAYNKVTIADVQKAGYKMALSTDGRWAMKKNGLFSLDRVYISSQFSLKIFKERLTNPNYPFL